MSYDITVGTREFNYTANMRQFFADFGVHPKDLHGESPQDVAHRIATALDNICHYPIESLKRDFDAPNDWGSVEGATRFLFEVYMACITDPDVDEVEVSW